MLILSNSSLSKFFPGHLNNNTCNTLKRTVVIFFFFDPFLIHGQIKKKIQFLSRS